MKLDKFLTSIKEELKQLIVIVREMDRKVIIIFLSVTILQTISWYYTSRNFFRINFFPLLQNNPKVFLYEYLYWFIGDFFTFFILAIIVIKSVLKEDMEKLPPLFKMVEVRFSISGTSETAAASKPNFLHLSIFFSIVSRRSNGLRNRGGRYT